MESNLNRKEEEALSEIFMNVQRMLRLIQNSNETHPEFRDIAISLQLLLVMASNGDIGELKVFLKNFALMDQMEEEKKKDPMTALLNMSICLN